MVALSLAHRAGIEVPAARIETVDGKQVLLLKRFDRQGAQRIPFLSAMSMLAAKDNERAAIWNSSMLSVSTERLPVRTWRRYGGGSSSSS